MYPMNMNIFFQLCDCFLLTYQFSKRTWFCRNKISTFINCSKIFPDILLQYAKILGFYSL